MSLESSGVGKYNYNGEGLASPQRVAPAPAPAEPQKPAPAPSSSPKAAPAPAPAPAAPAVPEQLADFDALINGDVQKFVELGKAIDGLVGEQVGRSW